MQVKNKEHFLYPLYARQDNPDDRDHDNHQRDYKSGSDRRECPALIFPYGITESHQVAVFS